MGFNRVALVEFRKIRMLSKSELATAAGIAPSYITDLESPGGVKRPSLATIRKLAAALEIDARALYVERAA